MPLSTGQLLERRYRVDALLGQGGMGAVYRATDLKFNTQVAIKENLEVSPEAQRQFQQEADLLHRLRHPNLPRVSDHFSIPGQGQYLVMDYVDGEDLGRILARRGPIPEAQALDWIRQVLDALEYLHSRRPQPVIHRDIKPANIKITPEGTVFLVDFGLAKVYHPMRSTTIGARGVTPGFAPPEQYGQGRTDASSDLYSVGATLYALLTGQTPPDALELVTGRAPLAPPRQVNPAVSSQAEAAVLRAMQTRPTDRFQTAAAFRAAFRGAPAPPPQPRPRDATTPALSRLPGWLWLAVAGVALLAAMVIGLVALTSGGNETPAPPATEPVVAREIDNPAPTLAGTAIPTQTPARTPSPTDTAAPTRTPTRVPAPTDTPFAPGAGDTWTRPADGAIMVYVPAGEFLMGSTDGDSRARDDEKPRSTVYLDAFWIDKTAVTNAQYRKCVEAGACDTPGCWGDERYNAPDRPVVCVGWDGARAYSDWVGGRLPTEAEWEKAARGTDGRIYPWGSGFDGTKANFCDSSCQFDRKDRTWNDGYAWTAPTGSYPSGASPYGALGMLGNVWEWCQSLYKPYPYRADDGREALEVSGPRVLRGGSFFNREERVRCAARMKGDPGHQNDGFRVVVPASTPGP